MRGAYVYPESNGMYIDSVSIKKQLPVNYAADFLNDKNRRIQPPIQYLDKSLKVTKNEYSTPKTITITFRMRNCMSNLSNFTLIDTFPANNATLTKTQSSSLPVTGTFNLEWNDLFINSINLIFMHIKIYVNKYKFSVLIDIPSDVSAKDLTDLLKKFTNFGNVNVTRSGDCSGYSWTLKWLNGGNKSPVTVCDLSVNPNIPEPLFIKNFYLIY